MRQHPGAAIAVVTLALAIATPARAMDKAQLVDLILKDRKAAYESKAAAERAFDAVIDAIRQGVQKDGKVQIIGFGPLVISRAGSATAEGPAGGPRAAGDGAEALGKKKVKLRYRNGANGAGVMVLGPNGLYEIAIDVPDARYLTAPLELELKLPKALSPKVVELTVHLPADDPQLEALLAAPGAFPLLVELGLPAWTFDDVPPDPNALDYYGEMFGAFHPAVGVEPCAETVLSDRLGLGGDPLCPPGDCGLADREAGLDALAAAIAPAAGATAEQARATIDVLLALPFEPPPGLPIDVLSGVGSFAVERRPELRESSASTGKRVKVKAKQVLRFQAGALLGPAEEEDPPPTD